MCCSIFLVFLGCLVFLMLVDSTLLHLLFCFENSLGPTTGCCQNMVRCCVNSLRIGLSSHLLCWSVLPLGPLLGQNCVCCPLKGATEVVKVEVKERNIDQLMEQQPVMWWVLLHLLELNTGAFFATFNHEILEMERWNCSCKPLHLP